MKLIVFGIYGTVMAILSIIIAHEPTYGNNKITESNVIEIANIEATKLGYDIQTMVVKATMHNTPWNEYLPKESNAEYYVERKNKLINKEYWAVYYYNPKVKKGGDLCIFIDSKNGNIITNYRGK